MSKINENLQIYFISKNPKNLIFKPTRKTIDFIIQENPILLKEIFLDKNNIEYIKNYHPEYFRDFCISADIVKSLFCSSYL